MERIPMPLAAALLAGVLARFGLDAFLALQTAPRLVLAMLAGLPGRRGAWLAALRGASACWPSASPFAAAQRRGCSRRACNGR